MARYNEILVGRYNRFLQKLLSMKGPASMPQLAGELQATFPFFNGVENRNLEGWGRWATRGVQLGVAAVRSTFQIRNPAGTNVVAVIEKAIFLTGAADSIVLSSTETLIADLATLPGSFRLDTRGQPGSASIVSNGTGTDLANIILHGACPTNSTIFEFVLFEDQEITIFPGQTYRFTANTVNEQLIGSLIWRERFLEDSERF